jgi:hypothetical protein
MKVITISTDAREYKDGELTRYTERLKKPGSGLGTCFATPTTLLPEEGVESHALQSNSETTTGKRGSLTLRDIIPRSDGTKGEVTIVINAYYDGVHDEDVKRASHLIAGGANYLTAGGYAELKNLMQLGRVNFGQ